MADEKEKSKETGPDQEVYGLDDEKPQKASLFGKLKKLFIPISIAVGALVISILIFSFVLNGNSKNGVQVVEDDKAKTEIHAAGSEEHTAEAPHGSMSEDQDDILKTLEHLISKERAQRAERMERAESTTIEETSPKRESGFIEIDSTQIMKELEFLFYTPEMDGEIGSEMTPEDSVDTLSWIQKEMARLAEEKMLLEKQRKELQAMEYKVDQSLVKIQQAESARIINLARLYDGMKPEQVAKLFGSLDDDVIIAILPRMKPANAAKILAVLPPKRAARISTQMITVLED